MGPKSLHFTGKEVYIVEATNKVDTWIVYGTFMGDGRPTSMCFPFYSFDGRESECKWSVKPIDSPSQQFGLFHNPLNDI